MKKLLYCKFLLAIILLSAINSSICFAEKKNKDIQKECKKMCKQLKSEGWVVYGSTLSLEDALQNYYKELENAGSEAQTVISKSEAKNTNLAMSKAKHHLKVQYASMTESNVSGETNVQVTNEASDTTIKSNIKFDSTYESSVNQRVQTLKPDLILTRTKDNGNIEIQMYLIVK